jgi:hypothetical protein
MPFILCSQAPVGLQEGSLLGELLHGGLDTILPIERADSPTFNAVHMQ